MKKSLVDLILLLLKGCSYMENKYIWCQLAAPVALTANLIFCRCQNSWPPPLLRWCPGKLKARCWSAAFSTAVQSSSGNGYHGSQPQKLSIWHLSDIRHWGKGREAYCERLKMSELLGFLSCSHLTSVAYARLNNQLHPNLQTKLF